MRNCPVYAIGASPLLNGFLPHPAQHRGSLKNNNMENVKDEVGMITKNLAEFEIRVEQVSMHKSETPVLMFSVYAKDGGYVGTIESAKSYFDMGIIPEKSLDTHNVCSIGKSVIDGKWYGWSHRALYGFSIGDEAKEGDLVTKSGYVDGYLEEHPEEDRRVPVGFIAKTDEDAKRMAIAFADSVS